ncbi:hypothetical protein F2P56_012561 [Juglans regia]|uniref:Uncharacterized protein n=2 Tax=Juglans regia TaxID=51240 RepID=A0A833XMI8_JUGRE|nr:uncharacterized protein LOC109002494 [Juglans regia]KAF5468409.1 hypothetical protein F2P56_012561 [Juglans regia]
MTQFGQVLTFSLNQAEQKGLISGFPISRGSLSVNHLFFADDSLVFCKAQLQEWGGLHNILSSYELASGQRLNLEKSSIYFSKNTRQEIQDSILAAAGFKVSGPFEKYLGLPSHIGKSKSRAFLPIIDRIKGQMTNWKTNLLSPAGKEVLLKSVIQSIPTYSMGIFLIPKGILRNINKLLQSFWWGIRNQNPKMHWLSWKGLGMGKQAGGLGFRDFEDFNRALLAKQGWRIITNPQSLASRVLKAKYFPSSDFASARVKRKDSFVWKSITTARPLLYEGLLWKIGNGNTVKIWTDRWLPTPSSYKSQSPPKILNSNATVSSLIDQDTHSWNLHLVHNVFTPEEAAIISKIHISPCNRSDKQVWRCTKNGIFSVKSAYHLQVSMNGINKGQSSESTKHEDLWKLLWKLKVPSNIKMFLWRSAKEILPTRVNLHKRKIIENPMCPICLTLPETVSHALWTCKAAQDVWCSSSRRLQKSRTEDIPFFDLLKELLATLPPEDLTKLALTAKEIWFRRNKLIFESRFESPQQVLYRVSNCMRDLEELTRNQQKHFNQHQPPAKWCKPPTNFYKINWDAAIDKVNCKVGIGVSIRDWSGPFTATLRSPSNSFPDPTLGEALATLRAVQFGTEMGLRNVIFEGDSLLVVNGINSLAEDWSSEGLIYQDIKLLLSNYSSCHFSQFLLVSSMAFKNTSHAAQWGSCFASLFESFRTSRGMDPPEVQEEINPEHPNLPAREFLFTHSLLK